MQLPIRPQAGAPRPTFGAPVNIANRVASAGVPVVAPPDQEQARLALARAGFTDGTTPIDRAAMVIVTQDAHMRSQIDLAKRFAKSSRGAHPINTIYVHGPSGTGKELFARLIASGSAKITPDGLVDHRMVSINCSGISELLFESLLFGHVRGSFTGAVADSPGLLASAEDGTAFLDEVGDLPPSQQAKLLRAIESRRVQPVGSQREVKISCRFVFATNKSLHRMMEAGTFRADLYYRIAQGVLWTTALVARPLDVPLITRSIINSRGYLEADADELANIDPILYNKGNVRQLMNAIIARQYLGSFDAVAARERQLMEIV